MKWLISPYVLCMFYARCVYCVQMQQVTSALAALQSVIPRLLLSLL